MLDPLNSVGEQKKFLCSSVGKFCIAWIAVIISFHVNRLKILKYIDLEKGTHPSPNDDSPLMSQSFFTGRKSSDFCHPNLLKPVSQ